MNKNLLYSTRNSTQYSVMTYMRKEKDRCMCITDSLCCTTETNSIVKINYTPVKIIMKKEPRALHLVACLLSLKLLRLQHALRTTVPPDLCHA